MKALVVVALVLVPALAFGKPKQGAWAIQRQTPATLPANATTDQIAELVVGAAWRQANPKKKTSTWESHRYEFDKSGSVTISGDLAAEPRKSTWKVVRGGAHPVVQIGAAKLTLEPCVRMDASVTLCMFER
jgi:hypothetical protein